MIKNIPSKEKALKKAESYCVYQERSQQEVRDRIYSWGLHQKDVEEIISRLVENGYLKEERFASAFTGGKFRIKKWGKVKIKKALVEKKVSDPLIRKALAEIEDTDYQRTLNEIIKAKAEKINEVNPIKRNYKIASYAISRGYEPDVVWESINKLFS